jgi:hypothetical protein
MGDPLQEHEWGIHYRSMSGGSITGVREGDPLQEHEWGIRYRSKSEGPVQEHEWAFH